MRFPNSTNPMFQLLFVGLLLGALILVVLNQLPWFFLLVLLLLLILLVWGLFQEHSDEPKYPPEEFYIQDELIVRGPADQVSAAVAAANAAIGLNRIGRIDFGQLSDLVKNCLNDCSNIDFGDFVIDLYTITGQEKDVAAAISAINRAVGRGSDVRAEPNWLSGRPWEPAGSGVDPWDPTGSGEGVLVDADPELFMNQWAFKHIGLHDRTDNYTGQNVRIGVFDTSPIENGEGNLPLIPLAWVNQPSQLQVEIIDKYRLLDVVDRDYDLSSHGLFTAGLAHAVAQNADIQIYRVLNDNNKGALYSLLQALFDFILASTKVEESEGQQRFGSVINLSLGIRVPPDEAGMALPLEVQSLRDLLRAAHCAGIVTVAATGNNSANARIPEAANLPANWTEIIGVAASNFYRKIACFSNRGTIAAPGGDGVQSKINPDGCVGATGLCRPNQDCEYGVIGPVLKNDSNTGFAFWSGTSFSAPMVAGLAACVIEKGRGHLSPNQVRDILECGAIDPDPETFLGVGIINIPKTMDCFPGDEEQTEMPGQYADYGNKGQSAA
jgi:subtilisin family serine protease